VLKAEGGIPWDPEGVHNLAARETRERGGHIDVSVGEYQVTGEVTAMAQSQTGTQTRRC